MSVGGVNGSSNQQYVQAQRPKEVEAAAKDGAKEAAATDKRGRPATTPETEAPTKASQELQGASRAAAQMREQDTMSRVLPLDGQALEQHAGRGDRRGMRGRRVGETTRGLGAPQTEYA